jgi:hypothetical protein
MKILVKANYSDYEGSYRVCEDCDTELTYNSSIGLIECPMCDDNPTDVYWIMYGRGECVEFDTLEEAKQWQVKNIFTNYADWDEPGEAAVKYDWRKSEGGFYDDDSSLEFVMYRADGSEIDTDWSDGSGWFIESGIEGRD